MSNTPNVKLQVHGDVCAEAGIAAVVDAHKGLLQNTLEHDCAVDEAEAKKIAAKEYFTYKTAIARIEAEERKSIRDAPTALENVFTAVLPLLPVVMVGCCLYMAHKETSDYEKNKQP